MSADKRRKFYCPDCGGELSLMAEADNDARVASTWLMCGCGWDQRRHHIPAKKLEKRTESASVKE